MCHRCRNIQPRVTSAGLALREALARIAKAEASVPETEAQRLDREMKELRQKLARLERRRHSLRYGEPQHWTCEGAGTPSVFPRDKQ